MTNKEIEEVGFKHIGGKLLASATQIFESYFSFKNKTIKVFMLYVPSGNRLNIFKEEKTKNNFKRETLFRGKIKNVEELKILIKQLYIMEETKKSLGNTDVNAAKKNVKDIVFFGDGDTFKLISKASSENEGWMKSTKAMQVDGVGCVIQVTTQQGDNIAEALTTMLGTKIEETKNSEGIITSRKIVINE